jgi:hypothetical protein
MSIYEVKSSEELYRILKSYELVVIQYLNPDKDKESRELYHAFRKLSTILSRNRDAIAAIIRTDKYPELARGINREPLLRVYHRGRIVFEQYGGFGERELDLYVLRRSIRDTLYKLNLRYRI